jgi:uncharacterized membrane protein YphA (DoxX/SURF4 family)
MTRISGLTCFLLVVLRLVIGWHFLVEGAHKIHTHWVGKTATNSPWTSAGFFAEGIGPAAPFFRELLGDPDRQALARLKPEDDQLPVALTAAWQDYLDRYMAFYGFDADQKAKATALWGDAKDKALTWLKNGTTEVTKTFPSGAVEEKQTTPQRVAEYEAKLRDIDDVMHQRLPAFNQDVEKARLRTLKAEAAKQRTDLLDDLQKQFDGFKKSLADLRSKEQTAKAGFRDEPALKPIDYLDLLTMWTHAILGGCLLVGLFTRASSLGLALFLVLVTLVAPALPYAPTPPGAIGYYLYVNLYVIEMVALLVLATVPTGRWFGLDALVSHVNPFRRRTAGLPAGLRERSTAASRTRR